MSKFSVLVILVALRIIYNPSAANGAPASFYNPSDIAHVVAAKAEARVISASANLNNNKVYINWAVSENQTADVFEIERSEDGKNFKMTAMVFGTDKPETDSYQFYEKAGNQKWVYRIKVISKDKTAEYSPVFSITPAV
jgi:hypothetical protein